MMRRRDFFSIGFALIGAASSRPSSAQTKDRLPIRTIGIQLGTSSQNREQLQLVSALVDELNRLGWIEGKTVRLELRWGDGDGARISQQARDLTLLKPSVIFAQGTTVVTQLKQAGDSIPIVFVNVADPVAAGFVRSLSHPMSNITGFTNYESSIAGKWVEFLKELTPSLERIVVVTNPGNPINARMAEFTEQTAKQIGVEAVRANATSRNELEETLARSKLDKMTGLVVMPDFVTTTNSDVIIQRSNDAGAISIFPFRMFAVNGGLAAYSINEASTFRQAASYVDRILRGTKPGELPVQKPTRFELVVNLKTAKILGLTVPTTLLARTDEVIE